MRKIRKIILLLIICNFIGCTSNKFNNYDLIDTVTLGIYNPEFDKECRARIVQQAKRYKNGVNPVRTCVNYREYLCRVKITCNNDKQCEQEAADYWIGDRWRTADGKWTDPVAAVKKYCERIQKQCDAAAPGDYSCLK